MGLISQPQTLNDLVTSPTIPTPTQPAAVPGTTATQPIPQVASPTNLTPANVASAMAPTPILPEAREVKAPETVAGQMNTLLAADSPYMQSAKANANAQQNSRGLLNSSMSVGASQKAAIDSAMPIAQQDANVYSQAAMSAQDARQQTGLTGYKSLLESAQQNDARQQEFANTTKLNQQSIEGNQLLQRQKEAAALTAQTQAEAASLAAHKYLNETMSAERFAALDANDRSALSSSISPMFQTMMAAINNVQTQPDSVMNAASKTAAIDQIRRQAFASADTMASLYGMQVSYTPV